jgi:sialidase-1
MIRIASTGLVYRNPKPYLRAIHTWHPSIVRLDDGELVAAFDLGQAVESLDYRTYLSRSTDGGQTWSPPTPLFQDKGTRRSTHSMRISRTADGTLLAFGGRFYRDDPEEGLVNRANLGYVPMDLFLLRSSDRGETWLGPQVIQPPLVGPSFETCHWIVELRDGRWLAPTSTWKGWNGEAPNGMKALALVSHDRGKTWPEYLDVMDDYKDGLIYWEQSLVQLPDDRLLVVAWVFDEKAGRSRPNAYAVSADGRTFGRPRPTGFNGQTAKIICLPDGRILCLYRREDKPGLWANLSRIDGEAWVNLEEALVWQGARSGMTGQTSAGEELAELKFGFPSMVRLPDGDVLALFWCSEDGINNVRWVRIRV